MEETGWKGADFSSLTEGPKPPEEKKARKIRAKASWGELVNSAKDPKTEGETRKPKTLSLEGSLFGVEKAVPQNNQETTKNPEKSQDSTESTNNELERLSQEETSSIISQTSREGRDTAFNEQAGLEKGDPNLAAAQAAEKFHKILAEQPNKDIDSSLDMAEMLALEQTFQEIDSGNDKENSANVDGQEVEMDKASSSDVEDDDILVSTATPSSPPQSPPNTLNAPPAPPNHPTPIPPFTPNYIPSPAPNPPVPPVNPTLPNFPPVPTPSPSNNTVNRNLNSSRVFGEQSKHSHWPYVLTGGVVGYLIGRRRGRIKTEEKLLPIQKKLEAEVKDLQWKIANREAKVRAMAYEHANVKYILAETPYSIDDQLTEQKPAHGKSEGNNNQVDNEYQEQSQQKIQEKNDIEYDDNKEVTNSYTEENDVEKNKSVYGSVHEPLSNAVYSSKSEESINRTREQAIESRYTDDNSKANVHESKDVSVMNSSEIMQIAKGIQVEGMDLLMLYKTGRLNEVGLRRIVSAYLGGENVDIKIRENLQKYDSIEQYPKSIGNAVYSDAPYNALSETDSVDTINTSQYFAEQLSSQVNAEQYSQTLPVGISESSETQHSIALGAIIGFCIAIAGIVVYMIVK